MVISKAKKARKLRDAACVLCQLHEGASTVCVFGDGHYKTPIVVLGEAPGYQEDQVGKPFVGRAGKLLRSELTRSGLNPASLYFTNTVKCFPDGTPSEEHRNVCSERYLYPELSALNPVFILACGRIATEAVAFTPDGSDGGGEKPWGRAHPGYNGSIVYSIYHPAYILRNNRRLAEWRNDLSVFSAMVGLEFGWHSKETSD